MLVTALSRNNGLHPGAGLQTRPLSPALGVAVRGIDLAQRQPLETLRELRRLLYENCVRLVPGQSLSEAQQVVFGEYVGALPDGEMYFHSDRCYVERPCLCTMLYGIAHPTSGRQYAVQQSVQGLRGPARSDAAASGESEGGACLRTGLRLAERESCSRAWRFLQER